MNRFSKCSLIAMASVISACTTQPEQVTYIEAAEIPTPEPVERIVEVVKPMPMPGQLQRIPEEKRKPKPKKDWEVVHEANKHAKHSPDKYGYFNAIMQFDYAPGALYQIYSAPLRMTDIQLQPGEKILGQPASGDSVRWKFALGKSIVDGVQREHVYIKPTKPGLYTSLSINTDRRTYHFQLRSYENTYMAAVMWNYPQDSLKEMQEQLALNRAEKEKITATQINLDAINFDYKVKIKKGSKPKWKPLQVFDDGRKTFIKFPKEMHASEAPVLFIISNTGEIQLANYRVKNDHYIVDRLFDIAELRVGQKKQTIIRINRIGKKLAYAPRGTSTKRGWKRR